MMGDLRGILMVLGGLDGMLMLGLWRLKPVGGYLLSDVILHWGVDMSCVVD